VQPKAGEVEALRAALDDTHLCFRKAIEAMSAAAGALADLTVALAPLELAARRNAVDEETFYGPTVEDDEHGK
jgi:hypothetical protein